MLRRQPAMNFKGLEKGGLLNKVFKGALRNPLGGRGGGVLQKAEFSTRLQAP